MGEGKGWISIYRRIQYSWLWQEKPFSKGQAWIDLLLSANHKDNKVLLGNELINVKRGSFITSQKKLMERWGWGSEKTRRFLKLLDTEEMIKLSTDKRKTTILVVNYKEYQNQNGLNEDISTDNSDTQNDNGIQTEYKQNDNRTPAETNNNENNDNNENKYSYMSDSNEYRLALYLFKFIKRNNPGAKEPNLQRWAKTFDYILRIDKRDIEEVKTLIKWCQDDNFWFKNILSPDKLRKQYDRLLLEMKKPQDKTHKQKNSTFNNFKPRDYDFKDLEKKLLGWEDK